MRGWEAVEDYYYVWMTLATTYCFFSLLITSPPQMCCLSSKWHQTLAEISSCLITSHRHMHILCLTLALAFSLSLYLVSVSVSLTHIHTHLDKKWVNLAYFKICPDMEENFLKTFKKPLYQVLVNRCLDLYLTPQPQAILILTLLFLLLSSFPLSQ